MEMDRVQFYPGLPMVEFMQRYATEAQCEPSLVRSRRNFHARFERAGRVRWQCRRCRHQSTATAGTIFA